VAEIYSHCDPRPHDPWPNHRVSSGASLAVTLAAYDAVGGMPDRALGKDIAFTALLDLRGFKVRQAMDVAVLTSCRLDGRASGGAADTMRHRRDMPDAPCDDELETAWATLRRAVFRGYLRQAYEKRHLPAAFLRLSKKTAEYAPTGSFAEIWQRLESEHGALRRAEPLRPSELPRQIAVAQFILRHL
jgi:hypothetical protein